MADKWEKVAGLLAKRIAQLECKAVDMEKRVGKAELATAALAARVAKLEPEVAEADTD